MSLKFDLLSSKLFEVHYIWVRYITIFFYFLIEEYYAEISDNYDEDHVSCDWQRGNADHGCQQEIKPISGFCSIKFTLQHLSQFCGENIEKAVAQINGVPLCHFQRQTLVRKYNLF